MLTENEYCAKLKAQTKKLYDSKPEIFCPYFSQSIKFTSSGFYHLQYKSSRTERTIKAQIRRYKTFPFAHYILMKATTVQQYRKYFDLKNQQIQDWCFVAILPAGPNVDIQVKVIVRKIDNGALNYLSVMPFKANYLRNADSD